MTDRTFKQHAQAYGSTPCEVVCQIDGNTVFSGTVATLDQPSPFQPDPENQGPPVAWSWQDSADFTGSRQFTVSVTGSTLLLGTTLANNPYGRDPTLLVGLYSQEIDDIVCYDPFINQSINGTAQPSSLLPGETGQTWWTIPAGSTFTATLNILAATQLDPAIPPA